jgi:hypothetical protein
MQELKADHRCVHSPDIVKTSCSKPTIKQTANLEFSWQPMTVCNALNDCHLLHFVDLRQPQRILESGKNVIRINIYAILCSKNHIP